jgi:RNA polymerase sigma-70 factor (ECF subfamily)
MEGPPSDATLLVGVGERDIGAFRTLYERHAGWLALRLARRCNDSELVADAVQDTFVAIWQKPRSFRGDGDVAAWLWGIAIRRLVSRLRRRTDVAAAFGSSETVPAAEDEVLLSVEYGDLGAALARLSPEMRAVIQAVVLDGLSAREAAQLLNVPVSSVKTRLFRAKAHLRAALVEGLS